MVAGTLLPGPQAGAQSLLDRPARSVLLERITRELVSDRKVHVALSEYNLRQIDRTGEVLRARDVMSMEFNYLIETIWGVGLRDAFRGLMQRAQLPYDLSEAELRAFAEHPQDAIFWPVNRIYDLPNTYANRLALNFVINVIKASKDSTDERQRTIWYAELRRNLERFLGRSFDEFDVADRSVELSRILFKTSASPTVPMPKATNRGEPVVGSQVPTDCEVTLAGATDLEIVGEALRRGLWTRGRSRGRSNRP